MKTNIKKWLKENIKDYEIVSGTGYDTLLFIPADNNQDIKAKKYLKRIKVKCDWKYNACYSHLCIMFDPKTI